VSLTPLTNIHSQISPRIFEKIRNDPSENSEARGTLIYEKNLKSKISCQTPFKQEENMRNSLPVSRKSSWQCERVQCDWCPCRSTQWWGKPHGRRPLWSPATWDRIGLNPRNNRVNIQRWAMMGKHHGRRPLWSPVTWDRIGLKPWNNMVNI
jgi:hypothetical protein